VTVTVSPAAVSPDLDVSVALLDGNGAAVTAADPAATLVSEDYADGLGATIRATIGAGTYYVRVDGVGYGDSVSGYTDYGSVGRYRLSVVAGAAANAAPIATAAASASAGRGPLTVTFTSNGSGDSDGQVVASHWDFGDGTTSDEPNPTHTFDSTGTYQVVLTVHDDMGASGTATVPIEVTSVGNRVSSLELTLQARSRTRSYAHAAVSTTSPNGGPLGRALVLGAWSGSDKRWVLGITDANGNVSFDSLNARTSAANYGFAVLWVGYLEHPNDWSSEAVASANVWNGGPNYWAAASPS